MEVETNFLVLKDDRIIIKWYYFPTTTSLELLFKDIEYITTSDRLGLRWWEVKSWGQAFSNIWWACDMFREFKGHKYNLVIKVNDDNLLKACTANLDVVTKMATKVYLK